MYWQPLAQLIRLRQETNDAVDIRLKISAGHRYNEVRAEGDASPCTLYCASQLALAGTARRFGYRLGSFPRA